MLRFSHCDGRHERDEVQKKYHSRGDRCLTDISLHLSGCDTLEAWKM